MGFFTKFIFWHFVLTTYYFWVCIYVFLYEFSFLFDRYSGPTRGLAFQLSLLLHYISINLTWFFLTSLSFMTSIALYMFFVHISSKYSNGLTMNLISKVEDTTEEVEKQMDLMIKGLESESATKDTFEKVKRDYEKILRFVQVYHESVQKSNALSNFIRLMF